MRTTFPRLQDLQLIYRMIRERDRRFFPAVPWRKLLTDISETDATHNEIGESEKRWAPPVLVHAGFIPQDEDEPVNQFGGERVRDIVLEISVPHLVLAGLGVQDSETLVVTPIARAGDLFDWNGITYEVLAVCPHKYFANTDVPISFKAEGARYRQIATQYAGI